MVIIGGDQSPPQSLFVGGCVRNSLMEESVTDVDIATQFTPQQITEKLEAAAIKVVPTGIAHGTVTAIVEGKPFEITTLRKDVATDGRRAEVAFTDDWTEDAKRRDFTMNALYADLSGNVYDPTGQGVEDLNARKVVFVGDPVARIQEDYLRVLRFFRFQAQYGRGEPDQEALKACRAAADKISDLSRERINQEFLKILATEKPAGILQTMFDHDVLKDLSDKNYRPVILEKLCALQDKFDAVEIMTRLFVIAGNKARFFDDYLRLSHAQKNFLVKLEAMINPTLYENQKALKKAIFYHGNELLLQGYLLMVAKGDVAEELEMIDTLQNWQAPECPITGETLIQEGYQTGPELGQELDRRREEWLEENV